MRPPSKVGSPRLGISAPCETDYASQTSQKQPPAPETNATSPVTSPVRWWAKLQAPCSVESDEKHPCAWCV